MTIDNIEIRIPTLAKGTWDKMGYIDGVLSDYSPSNYIDKENDNRGDNRYCKDPANANDPSCKCLLSRLSNPAQCIKTLDGGDITCNSLVSDYDAGYNKKVSDAAAARRRAAELEKQRKLDSARRSRDAAEGARRRSRRLQLEEEEAQRLRDEANKFCPITQQHASAVTRNII